jgi:DNA-binding winged helix-turn-helix (wHTH) protein
VSRIRYRFGEFCVSPTRRALLRSGQEVPLIPRYLDLLILLLERRHEAVHRREIFDAVWTDVVVSDGALSQAVRTLRRALGDDSREPLYIRTVSRHGYRFAFDGVVEEAEDERPAPPAPPAAPAVPGPGSGDPMERALETLLGDEDADERRQAAEFLHALGTAEALRRLDRRPGHEAARALLRDARWDVPGAGPVPLLGQPGGLAAARLLVGMRLRRVLQLASRRWTAASGGGAAAGALAGALGGLALRLAPGAHPPASVAVTLALVGAIVGGLGAAGVGAGLAAAESVARSRRDLVLVLFGALGGGSMGAVASLVGRWALEGLFGRDLPAVGGGIEGLALGAAAGLGYALATPRREGGMATPRGAARLRVAAATGLSCALAALAVTALGGQLTGASLNFLARSFQGSQVGLAPVARMLGEPELGPLSRSVLAAYEGAFFGFGLALGLTRRPA